MKSITIKFCFKDEDLNNIEELAEKLNISTQDLMCQFLSEGISLSWDAFEYEAQEISRRKALEAQKISRRKALSEKYDVPIEKVEQIEKSLYT